MDNLIRKLVYYKEIAGDLIQAVLTGLMLSVATVSAQEPVALREDFNNLDNWRPLNFPKIERHSEYVITLDEISGKRILTTRSSASASGIIFKGSFNPSNYPTLRWRWKVDNVYFKADPHTKQGDDYPLRVYVIFECDPDKAGLAQRAMYGLAKKLYG